ncbi:MAG: tRNA (adenosine(37)-N6)-threonylcarbamoyltransferase complex ATPase subunit type 1 TsaE [Pelagibacterales bacterium]|nr:tRNA (adenosine(37)-N6)-threonylcarbamoyltransferase complex ATPase subunit type 1 TsaE [Pelagibacterales bacterium]
MKNFIINSQQEMANFAKETANKAKTGDIIGLKGTLGAGKSFFARNFINSLSDKEQTVTSPTFNLVFSYPIKKGEIFHFDLYRLKSEEELENIGFFDAIKNGICLIEWPEIAKKFLKKNYTEIEIKILGEEQREILITQ